MAEDRTRRDQAQQKPQQGQQGQRGGSERQQEAMNPNPSKHQGGQKKPGGQPQQGSR